MFDNSSCNVDSVRGYLEPQQTRPERSINRIDKLVMMCGYLACLIGILSLSSCSVKKLIMINNIDLQGHRGCRGLLPENTIPAFLRAVDLGVHTLELDVVANQAGEVFVSHEPFFNHEISTAPDGSLVGEEVEREHNMYGLSKAEIQSYDVGMRAHPRFADQEKIAVHKPLLSEMVLAVETYLIALDLPKVRYNIEIKRVADHDEVFHPKMETFADLVYEEIKSLGIMDRTTIQCFDVATLQYLHRMYPSAQLVYLIENLDSFEENIQKLGFEPSVYSPYFQFVNEELVSECRARGIQLIPWTVNEEEDIAKMIRLNVDGIISDYPDRLVRIYNDLKTQR